MNKEEEDVTIQLLRKKLNLFAWALFGMAEIDPKLVFHHLAIKYGLKTYTQRKRKNG